MGDFPRPLQLQPLLPRCQQRRGTEVGRRLEPRLRSPGAGRGAAVDRGRMGKMGTSPAKNGDFPGKLRICYGKSTIFNR